MARLTSAINVGLDHLDLPHDIHAKRVRISMIAEWINFGQVSAERDENLSKYFFDNGVLQSIIGNRYQFLVLGRKGAGKTAVFQHLSDNPDKYLSTSDSSVNLYLQNYSWNVHGLLATEGKASSLAYIR
jgi:hypothetical protein